MRVVSVVGARPNFVKLAALNAAFIKRRVVEHVVIHTDQHYDFLMAGGFFQELAIPEPQHHLGVGSGSAAEQIGRTMIALEPVLQRARPDWVLCVGDVNATVATALVAKRLGQRVVHVEAGLRSFDWSMPEEVNRVVTDRLADLLLASEPSGVENLRCDGVEDGRVKMVGNVMIDTLHASLPLASARGTLAQLGLAPRAYGVVTLHRPSNTDDPQRLLAWMRALEAAAAKLPLVFPLHPRTQKSLDVLGYKPASDALRLLPPQGYLDMLALLQGARVALTDSGGIQEETTALGVACLTLRGSTERPATIAQGTNTLVGADPAALAPAFARAIASDAPARGPPALWDGRAAERVVDELAAGLALPMRAR